MFSRRLAIHFYLVAVTFLFAMLLQTASAAPAPEPVPEPEANGPTPGEVIAKNHNLACYAGSCYYTTNHTSVENTTDASTVRTNSTEETQVTNSALSLRDVRVALPVVAAGTSLLFLL